MKPPQTNLPHGAPPSSRRRRKGLSWLCVCTLAAALSFPGLAQAAPTGLESLENLSIFAPERLTVEINLGGSLLKLVAGSMAEEDPEFAALLSGLRGIRVRVSEVGESTDETTALEIRAAVAGLTHEGWTALVRMQDEGEEVFIYLKEDGEKIDSLLVVFFSAGEEAGIIHVDGAIDVALLGRLISNLGGEHLGDLSEKLQEPTSKPAPAEETGQ